MEDLMLFNVEPEDADFCDSDYCTTIFCASYTYLRRCYDPVTKKYVNYCNCPSVGVGSPTP
jgi:hypothetical protein